MKIGDKKVFDFGRTTFVVVYIGKEFTILEDEKGAIRTIKNDKSTKN